MPNYTKRACTVYEALVIDHEIENLIKRHVAESLRSKLKTMNIVTEDLRLEFKESISGNVQALVTLEIPHKDPEEVWHSGLQIPE